MMEGALIILSFLASMFALIGGVIFGVCLVVIMFTATCRIVRKLNSDVGEEEDE